MAFLCRMSSIFPVGVSLLLVAWFPPVARTQSVGQDVPPMPGQLRSIIDCAGEGEPAVIVVEAIREVVAAVRSHKSIR